jgi:hypothetical protein
MASLEVALKQPPGRWAAGERRDADHDGACPCLDEAAWKAEDIVAKKFEVAYLFDAIAGRDRPVGRTAAPLGPPRAL